MAAMSATTVCAGAEGGGVRQRAQLSCSHDALEDRTRAIHAIATPASDPAVKAEEGHDEPLPGAQRRSGLGRISRTARFAPAPMRRTRYHPRARCSRAGFARAGAAPCMASLRGPTCPNSSPASYGADAPSAHSARGSPGTDHTVAPGGPRRDGAPGTPGSEMYVPLIPDRGYHARQDARALSCPAEASGASTRYGMPLGALASRRTRHDRDA